MPDLDEWDRPREEMTKYRLVSLEASRRNRRNRKNGRRTSAELADYLGAQDVENRNLPWDVQSPAFRIQSKRDVTARSSATILSLIRYIPAGDYLRGLYRVLPRQRLTTGTVALLLEEWVGERGWSLPPGSLVNAGVPLLVLDLPVFRDYVSRRDICQDRRYTGEEQMSMTPRSDALEALAEALEGYEIAEGNPAGASPPVPLYDVALNLADYLDAHPRAKAALARYCANALDASMFNGAATQPVADETGEANEQG